jgi:glycosyltransferase involved in cell wall biosynthesis
MNILCIYPGMTELKNDNSQVLIRLRERGARIAVITSRSLHLKGSGRLPLYENMDGVDVHRFYRNALEMFLFPNKELKKVARVAEKLQPDIIFCSQELNIRLAMALKRLLKKPIVLLVEDAGSISSGNSYYRLRDRVMLGFCGIPSGANLWSWLSIRTSAIITCHPRDRFSLRELSEHGKPVFYVPWPLRISEDFVPPVSRNKDQALYIGSLYPFKNTQEFAHTLPRILSETQTRKFVVVGPGPHAEIIKKLEKETKGAVKYIPELSHKEALRLIAGSYYAYTPVIKGGWGFIGDCWITKTPVVMSHNDGYVVKGVNALVCESEDSLIENINQLYVKSELYNRLQNGGYAESLKRGPDVVSAQLLDIFTRVLMSL